MRSCSAPRGAARSRAQRCASTARTASTARPCASRARGQASRPGRGSLRSCSVQSGTDADTGADADADTDTGAGADTDTDTDADTDTDTGTDTGTPDDLSCAAVRRTELRFGTLATFVRQSPEEGLRASWDQAGCGPGVAAGGVVSAAALAFSRVATAFFAGASLYVRRSMRREEEHDGARDRSGSGRGVNEIRAERNGIRAEEERDQGGGGAGSGRRGTGSGRRGTGSGEQWSGIRAERSGIRAERSGIRAEEERDQGGEEPDQGERSGIRGAEERDQGSSGAGSGRRGAGSGEQRIEIMPGEDRDAASAVLSRNDAEITHDDIRLAALHGPAPRDEVPGGLVERLGAQDLFLLFLGHCASRPHQVSSLPFDRGRKSRDIGSSTASKGVMRAVSFSS